MLRRFRCVQTFLKKEGNNNKLHMPEKDGRMALDRERVWYLVPAASHSRPSTDRNQAPKRVASTAPGAQGFGRLDAGSRAGSTSPRLPQPWTSIFQIPSFGTICGLEKLGFVDQNWLKRNLSSLLLRTLVVGRRQQSESIEVALDME